MRQPISYKAQANGRQHIVYAMLEQINEELLQEIDEAHGALLRVSILRKDARDLPRFTGDCQGQCQEQAGFLGIQVIGDQEAVLGETGAFESPTTASPRGLDYHSTVAHGLCERFQNARPAESGSKASRHNPLRASLDEGTHRCAI